MMTDIRNKLWTAWRKGLFSSSTGLTPIMATSINGTHYQKTAAAWLARMDAQEKEIRPLFAQNYGADIAARWWVYWRVFFLACAGLWDFRMGEE